MSGITPVSLESMIALNNSAQTSITEGSELDKAAIEKAFLSLLMENMNLINMGSIDGDKNKAKDSHVLIDQLFKGWLIEQESGLGNQSTGKGEG